MKKRIFSTAVMGALVSAAVSTGVMPASAIEARIEVGTLTCEVQAGSGFIVGSKKQLDCDFQGIDGFSEYYSGNVRKFGIDIGRTERSTIVWIVFAPTTELESGALEGTYVGLSAEASVGAGLGANALVGSFDQSIALQPFSGQAQRGVNLAAGIGTMTLRSN